MYLVAHFTLINESRHFTDFKIFYSLNYFSKNDNVIALKLYLDFIGRHVIPVMRALTELIFFSPIFCTKVFPYLINIYKIAMFGKMAGVQRFIQLKQKPIQNSQQNKLTYDKT